MEQQYSRSRDKGSDENGRTHSTDPLRGPAVVDAADLNSQDLLRRCWSGTAPKAERQMFFQHLLTCCKAVLREKASCQLLPAYGYVADCHGDGDSFLTHLTHMRQRGVNRIVVLGDAMDQHEGDNSTKSGAVRIMQEVMRAPDISYVLGNHDLLLMQAMSGDAGALAVWVNNGALSTMRDMGVEENLIHEIDEVWSELERELLNPTGSILRRGIYQRLGISDGLSPLEHLGNLLRQMQKNPGLRGVNDFLRRKSLLYFVDSYGSLGIHAGLPIDSETGSANFEYNGRCNLEALAHFESLLPGNEGFRCFASMAAKGQSFLWRRGCWEAFQDERRSSSLLSSLGMLRIIHGHEGPRFEPGLGRSPLLEAGVSHGGGLNGWFLVDSSGIVFVDEHNNALEQLALPGRELLESVADECRKRLEALR
jgi:hypothetical protein